jgi:hypothetical protein
MGGGGTVDETVNFLRTGSLGRTMLDGVDAETAARAIDAMKGFLEQRMGGDGVRLGAAVWVVHAVA